MGRLINAEALEKRFGNYMRDCLEANDHNAANVFEDCIAELDSEPTIDAVEVVRCGECRFNSTCERIVKIVPKNSKGGSMSAHLHGCEYGERKDGVHSAGQNAPENSGKAHRDADGEAGEK